MAYMGIMAAINIIFAVIVAFVPVLSIFLMLILPLTSAIVTIFCKEKYYIIYALATIGLSLTATIFNIQTTIFYIVPSILTGFCFGMMIKYRVNTIWVLITTAIIQTIFTLATIPLIDLLFDTDIVLFFKTVFRVDAYVYIDTIIPSVIFFMSLTQMLFSYIMIASEIRKFDYSFAHRRVSSFWTAIYVISSIALCLIFAFFFVQYAYVFLVISYYFLAFLIASFIQRKYKLSIILSGIALLGSMILFGLFYNSLENPYGLLLFGIFPAIVSIIAICNSLLKKELIKDRINNIKAGN